MKINDILDAKCKDISFEGKGVALTNEGVVFVDGFFPDEEGQIQVLYKRNGSYFGKLKKLEKISESRIQSRCPVCTACGGCQLQQLKYQNQLEYKSGMMQKLIAPLMDENGMFLPIIGMENPYNYRNKIAMPFGLNKRGQIIVGFYTNKTNKIVPIKECVIQDKRINDIVEKIKNIVIKNNIKIYDSNKNNGVLRHILVRTSQFYDEIMLVLVTTCELFDNREKMLNDIKIACPNITTIIQNINDKKTNVILGDKDIIIEGDGRIKERILDVDFYISSQSFFQVNTKMMIKLYNTALKFANINENDTIFDAYCGIGTISLLAAKKAKKVVGVEIVPEAILDAKENANLNSIENAQFFEGDAGEVLKKFVFDKQYFDVVMVDPPRKGLSIDFINSLKTVKPKRIVYISCNPLTLVRDIKLLSDYYDLKMAQPVDMFPFTKHVENVVLLERKSDILTINCQNNNMNKGDSLL